MHVDVYLTDHRESFNLHVAWDFSLTRRKCHTHNFLCLNCDLIKVLHGVGKFYEPAEITSQLLKNKKRAGILIPSHWVPMMLHPLFINSYAPSISIIIPHQSTNPLPPPPLATHLHDTHAQHLHIELSNEHYKQCTTFSIGNCSLFPRSKIFTLSRMKQVCVKLDTRSLW